MPVSLSGTDGVVSGAPLEPLHDMGRGGDSVNWVTRSSTEGHPASSELNAGVAVDRRNCDEMPGVKGADSGIDIRHRLQQDT